MKKILASFLVIALAFSLPLTVPAGVVSNRTIQSATVSNIKLPEPGTVVSEYVGTTERPDNDKEYYYVSNKDCYWTTESGLELRPESSFSKGTVYYYSIVLKTLSGYVFAQDAKLNITGGSVEKGMKIMISNAGQEITFKNAYKITCGVGETPPTISSVALTSNTFYYNGKAHRPTDVTVKDENGDVVDPSSYRISYSNPSPTEVDVYTLTVDAISPATGSASTTFKICPATPQKVKVKGKKGKVLVRWKEPKSDTPDYYDVFVYADPSCQNIVTSAKVAETRKLIGGLERKKEYYIKVDCFVQKEATLVSKASAAVKVKVK